MRPLARRGTTLAVGCSLALAALLAVPTASAFASAFASAAGAADRTITLEGRGFGHGRGLSQWGARGMAERGASWRAIVAHYYQGTRLGRRTPGEQIRVLVASSPSILVTSARRFTIRWADGRVIGSNDSRRRFVRVQFAGGRYVVDKAASPRGPWRRVTRSRSGVVFVRGRSPLEVVTLSGASRAYRGTIEVRRRSRILDAINHLPLEEYLMGVVPRETPSSWPADALRAQAVAARSYAVALKERSRKRSYDICATTACQVYGGLASRPSPGRPSVPLERGRTTDAVMNTARMVLTWRGGVAMAEYSSSSGGTTAAGRSPYLRAVADPADRISPHHSWTKRIDASVIERTWRIGRLRRIVVRARDGAGEWGGRVRTVRIIGSRGSVDVPGGTLAARLGLRSRWYRVQMPAAAAYRFTRTIGPGTKGRDVVELQRRLRAAGFYAGRNSGLFDAATREAVRRYQRARRIRATGNLGSLTRARLNAESAA